MKKITLRVISKPKPHTCTIIRLSNGAKFKGEVGETTLVCGSCKKVLAEKIEDGQLRNLVLGCECGAYNRIPMAWERFHLRDIKETWNFGVLVIGLLLLIISQFVQKYSGITFVIGLLLAILSALILLFPKKITRYFSED